MSKIWDRFCIWFPQSSTDGVSGCNRLSLLLHTWYARYSLLKKEGLLHDIQFCLLMPSNKTTKVVLRLLNFQFIFWHSILIDWYIDLVDIRKCFYSLSNASNLHIYFTTKSNFKRHRRICRNLFEMKKKLLSCVATISFVITLGSIHIWRQIFG